MRFLLTYWGSRSHSRHNDGHFLVSSTLQTHTHTLTASYTNVLFIFRVELTFGKAVRMCPRAYRWKVYTRHRNKLEKHKSDWAAAGEIKGGEGSFHSRLLSSHLDIEAEASVFIRSHLDQDQVIVRDYSVQLEEHKSSRQHHGSAHCQTTAPSAQTLTAADPVSLIDSFSFLLHEYNCKYITIQTAINAPQYTRIKWFTSAQLFLHF